MVLTTIAHNAVEQAARLSGCHYAMGTNAIRRRTVDPQWSASGLWFDSAVVGVGSNRTDPSRLPRYVADSLLWEITSPTSVSGLTSIYLLFDLTPGTDDDQTIDTILIKPGNFSAFGGIDVRVRFADDEDFSDFGEAPAAGLVQQSLNVTSNRPIVVPILFAGTNGNVYQNLRYARIDLSLNSGAAFGSVVPSLTEVVFGLKRQFGHTPREPWDPTHHRSGSDDFTGKGGATARDINFEMQSVLNARFKPHPGSFTGVDEIDNLEALFADTRGGLRPFFYCSEPDSTVLGPRDVGRWVIIPEAEKYAPFVNRSAQEISIPMIEQPPFYLAEV
jgi:hypothetical protein